jgi:DeoR/GlpR family transcriptional regulator of sugar metabolism
MANRLKEERQELILQATQDHGHVTVGELSRSLDVSAVTVRRDLRELAAQGLLHRAHGGAVRESPASPEPPVVQRMGEQDASKARIGRTAAALVSDGESVFIGSGSTTVFVARNLVDRKDLTVVTNALNVAAEFATAGGVTVVVTGGMMRASELSLVGHITEQALREVRVDRVIMGMWAIDLEGGMTNDYLPEVVTDRTIIEMATELVLVADHTKFGKVAAAYVAPVERITTLVTDAQTNQMILTRLQQMGVRVVIAN